MNWLQQLGNFFAGVKETIEDVKAYIETLKKDDLFTTIVGKTSGKDVRNTIEIIINFLKKELIVFKESYENIKKDHSEAIRTILKHDESIEWLNNEIKLKDEEIGKLQEEVEKLKDELLFKNVEEEKEVVSNGVRVGKPIKKEKK